MHDVIENLNLIKNKVNKIVSEKQLKTEPKVIVVTKKFSTDKILPLVEKEHLHFGENKVQEAEDKWTNIKKKFPNIQLHMIGKLQSNKAKKAITLFDYIHSLDSPKLASKIAHYEIELKKKTKLFIQVNLGDESQKSGILLNDLDDFYYYCLKEISLNIIGLMCLPPIDSNSIEYFKMIKNLANKYDLKHLSIGMSSDYENAVVHGSTFLRLGTSIMGSRDK
jgi:pyridoxal phosphate enzyme (YggS family)